MKRFYVILICLLVVIVTAIIITNFYFTHKTRYLNLQYYDIYTKSFPDPAYMELANGLSLKAYPDETMFSDEQIIKKVLDYLNSIPLVCVTEKKYNANVSNENYGVYLKFYNKNKDAISYITINGEETKVISENSIGWVYIRGEEYIQDSRTGQVYKVRDEGTQIITGLEALDFD